MSVSVRDRLYELLPVVYRMRDADRGQPLRALLGVIENELQFLEDDIRQLYANWFIETCDEWVVPYLGDLLGVRNLHSVPAADFTQRAYVANTLAYRRRKGTAAMLEQLARDVTGWPAKAVEFFELLGTTQHIRHLRPFKGGTVDLRDANGLELIDGPFDHAAHTLEVRHIDNGRGRYNIANLGLFLWRLQAYPLTRATASAAANPDDGRYTFQPLGYDLPLYNSPKTETRITQLAGEVNVPGPLRRRALADELEARRQAVADGKTPGGAYFGSQPVLQVFLPGQPDPIPSQEIVICNLSDWGRPPTSKTYGRPDGQEVNLSIQVAVDPVLGRIAFPAGVIPGAIEVSYAYGFSGDVGGGPYDRRRSMVAEDQPVAADTVTNPNALGLRIGVPSEHAAMDAALTAWEAAGKPAAVIELEDSATYPTGSGGLTLNMADTELVIQAVNRQRPVLIGDIIVAGGGAEAKLTLDGLLIAGNLRVQGNLAELNIIHCTLVPGTKLSENRVTVASQDAQNNSINDQLHLAIDHSIVGPLRLPVQMGGLTIRDSIILAPSSLAIGAEDGGGGPGPPVTLERTTVLGPVHVKALSLASEVIFDQPVTAEQHQNGCVRFSFVPEGSRTPRRYRCQPDLALAERARQLRRESVGDLLDAERSSVLMRIQPSFTSTEYGRPEFAQLSMRCAEEIRTGSEDGSEMGVFSFLKQPQREANLRTALDEYLRFGLEAGVFFAS